MSGTGGSAKEPAPSYANDLGYGGMVRDPNFPGMKEPEFSSLSAERNALGANSIIPYAIG